MSSYSDTELSEGREKPVQDSPVAGVRVTRSLVQHVSCRQWFGGGLWIRSVSETSVSFSASRRLLYTDPRLRLCVVTPRFHGDPISEDSPIKLTDPGPRKQHPRDLQDPPLPSPCRSRVFRRGLLLRHDPDPGESELDPRVFSCCLAAVRNI